LHLTFILAFCRVSDVTYFTAGLLPLKSVKLGYNEFYIFPVLEMFSVCKIQANLVL